MCLSSLLLFIYFLAQIDIFAQSCIQSSVLSQIQLNSPTRISKTPADQQKKRINAYYCMPISCGVVCYAAWLWHSWPIQSLIIHSKICILVDSTLCKQYIYLPSIRQSGWALSSSPQAKNRKNAKLVPDLPKEMTEGLCTSLYSKEKLSLNTCVLLF